MPFTMRSRLKKSTVNGCRGNLSVVEKCVKSAHTVSLPRRRGRRQRRLTSSSYPIASGAAPVAGEIRLVSESWRETTRGCVAAARDRLCVCGAAPLLTPPSSASSSTLDAMRRSSKARPVVEARARRGSARGSLAIYTRPTRVIYRARIGDRSLSLSRRARRFFFFFFFWISTRYEVCSLFKASFRFAIHVCLTVAVAYWRVSCVSRTCASDRESPNVWIRPRVRRNDRRGGWAGNNDRLNVLHETRRPHREERLASKLVSRSLSRYRVIWVYAIARVENRSRLSVNSHWWVWRWQVSKRVKVRVNQRCVIVILGCDNLTCCNFNSYTLKWWNNNAANYGEIILKKMKLNDICSFLI